MKDDYMTLALAFITFTCLADEEIFLIPNENLDEECE